MLKLIQSIQYYLGKFTVQKKLSVLGEDGAQSLEVMLSTGRNQSAQAEYTILIKQHLFCKFSFTPSCVD